MSRSLIFDAMNGATEEDKDFFKEVADETSKKQKATNDGLIQKMLTALRGQKGINTRPAQSTTRRDSFHQDQLEELIANDKRFPLRGLDTMGKRSKQQPKAREDKKRNEAENIKLTLMDRPNSKGVTPLIYSIDKNYEITRILLMHGANPDVPDADGQTALHKACKAEDIKRVILLLRNKARFKKAGVEEATPDIQNLFVDRNIADINELVTEIRKSKDKIAIYNKVFTQCFLIFDLLEENKQDMLFRVLGGHSHDPDPDLAEFLNVYDNEKNTALHVATSKGLIKTTSLLLAAGAAIKANKDDVTPRIERFFSRENRQELTASLVHGLVKKTKKGLIKINDTFRILKLELDNGKPVMSLMEGREGEERFWSDVRALDEGAMLRIAPKMGMTFIEWIIEEAKRGNIDKRDVGKMVIEENEEGSTIISLLDSETQKEVAGFNRYATLNVAHLLDLNVVKWLLEEALQGRLDQEKVGKMVNKKDREGAIILSRLDPMMQMQVAGFNKEATVEAAHLMDLQFIEWLLTEVGEGEGWDKSEVYKMLNKKTKDGKTILACLNLNSVELAKVSSWAK